MASTCSNTVGHAADENARGIIDGGRVGRVVPAAIMVGNAVPSLRFPTLTTESKPSSAVALVPAIAVSCEIGDVFDLVNVF